MMQQVASTKPESAASALPFEFSNENPSNNDARQSFDNVFKQESDQSTAYAQARKNAEKNAFQQPAQSNSGSRNQAKEAHSEELRQDNLQASRNKEALILEEKANANAAQERALKSTTQAADNPTNSKTEAQSTDTHDSIGNTIENANEEQASLAESANSENIPALKSATSVAVDTLNSDDFDYITYVSQLAELNGEVVLAATQTSLENNKEVNIALEQALDIQLMSDNSAQQDAKTIELSLDSQESNLEQSSLLRTGIDKEQLQTILDAQNASIDLNAELNQHELQKLKTIIKDMLNQLEQTKQNEASLEQADIAQIEMADEALLANLLLNTARNEKAAQDQENKASLENLNAVSAVNELDNSSQIISEQEQSTSATDNVSAQTNKLMEQRIALPKQEVDPKTDDKNIWRKTPDLSNIKALPEGEQPPEIVKTPIDNIVALQDEQTQLAASSLNERLQTLVSDLKAPGKGSEFVAALQSSIKEFKQQLSQGHEPGLSFKDLVNEALESVNVDTDSALQPKIDAAVNQINALVNLANSVNYSANQQQAQILGISDNQLAKEINLQQIEGTKIANAIDKQVNNEKAINIFKEQGQIQLAEKVRWMVNTRNPSAEIRLDPPDLGGVNIKVNLSGDTAQVNFTVQSMGAKEALEQAAPRLRDMLQQQGIELGQTSVQQDSQGQKNDQHGEFADSGQAKGNSLTGSAEESLDDSQDHVNGVIEQRISGSNVGGIDYYA